MAGGRGQNKVGTIPRPHARPRYIIAYGMLSKAEGLTPLKEQLSEMNMCIH